MNVQPQFTNHNNTHIHMSSGETNVSAKQNHKCKLAISLKYNLGVQ